MCIRVSRVTNAVTNSQKHVDTPLLAAYHLFTQNLFILFATFDLSSYPDNYYDKCDNKDNKDDSKGGIEHLFILVHNICVFDTADEVSEPSFFWEVWVCCSSPPAALIMVTV